MTTLVVKIVSGQAKRLTEMWEKYADSHPGTPMPDHLRTLIDDLVKKEAAPLCGAGKHDLYVTSTSRPGKFGNPWFKHVECRKCAVRVENVPLTAKETELHKNWPKGSRSWPDGSIPDDCRVEGVEF